MRVIITGAKGNLGSRITANADFEVIPISRGDWGSLEAKNLGDSDVFIHCAYDLKKKMIVDPDEVLDSNIISTMHALKLCKKNNLKKFIFISSCSVYGHSSRSSEDIKNVPITINGLIKHLNEKIIINFCEENKLDYQILRVFNSYGGNDEFSVLSKLLKSAKDGSEFTLYNKGLAERDFIHIDDVSKIICHYVRNKSRYNILNVGRGVTTKIVDILDVVQKNFGPIRIRHSENINEVEYSRANINKLESEIKLDYICVFDFINNFRH